MRKQNAIIVEDNYTAFIGIINGLKKNGFVLFGKKNIDEQSFKRMADGREVYMAKMYRKELEK